MTSPTAPSHGVTSIILMPSVMNRRPSPSTMPRMMGLAATFVARSTVLVAPMRSHARPVNRPAPQITPGLIAPPEAMATPPMAFMGCTGIGVL